MKDITVLEASAPIVGPVHSVSEDKSSASTKNSGPIITKIRLKSDYFFLKIRLKSDQLCQNFSKNQTKRVKIRLKSDQF